MGWFDDGGDRQLKRADEGPSDEDMLRWYEERELSMTQTVEHMVIDHIQRRWPHMTETMSDGDKLRVVASWFERVYPSMVRPAAKDLGNEVETDLHRIADRLDRLDRMERPLRREDIHMKEAPE